MRQAGVEDSAQQANMFKKALNQQDHYLLTSDADYRNEEESGTTIQLIINRMVKLLVYREENAAVFKQLHNISRPAILKTTANQVTFQGEPTTIPKPRPEPQLSKPEWESKVQAFKALPEEEKKKLRKKCHICMNFGCHSDRHLRDSPLKAGQIKFAPVEGDTTSDESDGYVDLYDSGTNSVDNLLLVE